MRGHEPNRLVETIYLDAITSEEWTASDQIGGRVEFGMPDGIIGIRNLAAISGPVGWQALESLAISWRWGSKA
jgi:hypothetical protein